jgi:hypothetical protein
VREDSRQTADNQPSNDKKNTKGRLHMALMISCVGSRCVIVFHGTVSLSVTEQAVKDPERTAKDVA